MMLTNQNKSVCFYILFSDKGSVFVYNNTKYSVFRTGRPHTFYLELINYLFATLLFPSTSSGILDLGG